MSTEHSWAIIKRGNGDMEVTKKGGKALYWESLSQILSLACTTLGAFRVVSQPPEPGRKSAEDS